MLTKIEDAELAEAYREALRLNWPGNCEIDPDAVVTLDSDRGRGAFVAARHWVSEEAMKFAKKNTAAVKAAEEEAKRTGKPIAWMA